jgi:hypothetical protein
VPAGGALASLTALGTTLGRVLAVSGSRAGTLPMMFYKARDNGGTWMWGPKGTVPEEGSQWSCNPFSLQWGYIAFLDSKMVGEQMFSVTEPLPLATELPDVGAEWKPQRSVNMKCINGDDAGVEVMFKASTFGTIDAMNELIRAVHDRITGGRHSNKIAPIVHLEKSSYQHKQYGPISTPVLTIVNWMSLEGPAPAPAPSPEPKSPPPAEQPRRRRVA